MEITQKYAMKNYRKKLEKVTINDALPQTRCHCPMNIFFGGPNTDGLILLLSRNWAELPKINILALISREGYKNVREFC